MSGSKWTVLAGFLLAFAAGMAVDRVRVTRRQGDSVPSSPASLADELQLSDSQRQAMERVWGETAATAAGRVERWRTIQADYDAAVRALLPVDERPKFDRLVEDEEARAAILTDEADRSIKDAADRTRSLLTSPQRARFDAVLKRRGPPPAMGPFGRRPTAAAGAPAATVPSTRPNSAR